MERAHYVRADDVLANEMHNQNQARTHASDLNLKLRNQYATTSDATALREEFAKIKSKPGTPQYAQEILNLRINHPDAMNDPRSVELLDKAARSHEEEANFLARAQAAQVTPQITGFHQGKTTYTVPKPAGTILDKVQARYDRVNAAILQHTEASDAEAKTKKKSNQPYSQAPALHAFQYEKSALEKRYPGLVQQSDQTNAQATPTATPQNQQSQIPRVTSAEDYNKIPSGLYIDPNGVTRRKP